jgi:hypothetical protein
MKKKQKTAKTIRLLFDEQGKKIADLIDTMAYLEESQNIKNSKNFLENLYQLNDDEA